MKKQVFLGGSCNPTNWRSKIAIPILKKAGIPFYNPQVKEWDETLVAKESKAKAESETLLFVIDNQTRAIASINEATENIIAGRKVLLVIEMMQEGISIDGEIITKRQLKDLNRARSYLIELASRAKNTQIFDTVEQALNSII